MNKKQIFLECYLCRLATSDKFAFYLTKGYTNGVRVDDDLVYCVVAFDVYPVFLYLYFSISEDF